MIMSEKTAFWFIEMTWNFMSLSDSLAFNITITMVTFSVEKSQETVQILVEVHTVSYSVCILGSYIGFY